MAEPLRAVLNLKLDESIVLLSPLMYTAPPKPLTMSDLLGTAELFKKFNATKLAFEPSMKTAPPFLLTSLKVKLLDIKFELEPFI